MAEIWPDDLPQYLQMNGAQQSIGDGLLEYAPDTGPPITRLRSTAVPELLSGNMICTDEQIQSFKAFFKTALLRGALPFEFPDPMTRERVLVKFTKESPLAWAPLGADNYQLNLSLLVLP